MRLFLTLSLHYSYCSFNTRVEAWLWVLVKSQLSPNCTLCTSAHEFVDIFLKKTTVTGLGLGNNIIHLYLCLFQHNQIKTTYEHIHGSYIIIMVFVVTNWSACICVLFERQNSKSEIDVLKISEQWWRLNISFNLTAAFSTSNKMAIIGTVPFLLTAKNNFIKGPWYERAYDNYKYSVKG